MSTESATAEVFVRPFRNVDSTRFVISVGGGREPVWKRDGTELFFRSSRGELFAAPVTTSGAFSNGTPKQLFAMASVAEGTYFRSSDVHPDGKRFLAVKSGGTDATELKVIFNWRVELERIGK